MCSLAVLTTTAQEKKDGRPHFNREEYRTKLEAFITERACLTTHEAEQFFAIYHEMKHKQRQAMKKAQQLKRTPCGKTEQEYSNAVMEIAKNNAEMGKIGETYYKKLLKVVPAEKVFRAIIADDEFHRDMLKKL